MNRSFDNRILGGVCGGLAQSTPLSPLLWRIIFVLLTLVTDVTGLLIYLVWWWLLPQELPSIRRRGGFGALLALLLTIVFMGLWIGRDSISTALGGPVYEPLLLVIMAAALLFRQLTAGRQIRSNRLPHVVLFLVALLFLLITMDVFPEGIRDLFERAWPALLVFFGLAFTLRDRMRFGGSFALLLTVALLGGVAVFAFNTRSIEMRDDNQLDYTTSIDEDVALIQVNLTTLATDVNVFAAPASERELLVNFSGSLESELVHAFDVDRESTVVVGTLTVTETRPNPYPQLPYVGRSSITIEVPQDVPVVIAFIGQSGAVNFDMASLDLERLNVRLEQGNALVTFPEYQPLVPGMAENPPQIDILDGNLRLVVPPDVGASFTLDQSRNNFPERDELIYAVEDNVTEWVLVHRQFNDLDVQLYYVLNVPRGQILLENDGS